MGMNTEDVKNPTITTKMVFDEREISEENVREAEKELDKNTLGLDALQIVEERKSLQWIKAELQSQHGNELKV